MGNAFTYVSKYLPCVVVSVIKVFFVTLEDKEKNLQKYFNKIKTNHEMYTCNLY